MELHGEHFIGAERSSLGERVFHAINPLNNQPLEPAFRDATDGEINKALRLAEQAFCEAREKRLSTAPLLHALADEIMQLGSRLIDRAVAETGLPEARFLGERSRTIAQLQMFAELVEEGSWVDARIDTAVPEREPLPKPDLRQMLIPVGPVVVFGASNFPLAFSVPGGDTASALAAGNPVVVKAHPAHPGTSELIASAFRKAIARSGFPEGFFSMLHGAGHEVGISLVRHPQAEAVGFTGSLEGGRALFNEANSRPRPIPVFAEMGSINPVFVLPSALEEKAGELAQALFLSMTLGAGQFCTNPGLLVTLKSEGTDEFLAAMKTLVSSSAPETMLHTGIQEAFNSGVEGMNRTDGVNRVARSATKPDPLKTEVCATILSTDSNTFLNNPDLSNEVFGPATLVVVCESARELVAIARHLEGHLTATVHGGADDLIRNRTLVATLEKKVGRLIFNGVPTGVEVCPSMHHGGPYPATSDARATSVGTNAIKRFSRPVCYQDFPQEALPPELRDENERGIWRLVDGESTRSTIAK